MSSVSGIMNIEQEGYVWQDETPNTGGPNAIIVRALFILGTSLQAISGLQETVPISFCPPGSKGTISTLEVYRLTRISKRELDAWADSSSPLNVSVRWTVNNQDTPVFTTTFTLTRDSRSGIVFSQNIDQERNYANRTRHSISLSPNIYTMAIPQQTQTQHRPGPSSRLAYCAACGKRNARPKRRRTVPTHQCWAAADDGGAQVIPSRASSSSWNAARQTSQILLEASQRYATEAYMRSGSTNELQQTRELSQRMLMADLWRGEDTWQSPR